MDILNTIGALLTLGMGCFGLFFPAKAAAFVGLQPLSLPGRSEFRATYGGLFVFAGLAPLITLEPLVFAAIGFAWAGAALGRLVSIFLDKAASVKNWGAVAFESAFALLLCVGTPVEAVIAQFQ